MINYDDRAQINADAAFSTVSPAHRTLKDRTTSPNPILCHSRLEMKGQFQVVVKQFPWRPNLTFPHLLLWHHWLITAAFCWWASFCKPPWVKDFFKVKNLSAVWASGGCQRCYLTPCPLRVHYIQVALEPTTSATATLTYLLKSP